MSVATLPGNVVTVRDAAAVAEEAAGRLVAAIQNALSARGSASVALSGGNTPRPAYERLAVTPEIDWQKVKVFWIDERAVPPTHTRSNYKLAFESLLSRVAIPAANVHRMLGESLDLRAAAESYDGLLRALLPREDGVPILDVAVVGMGDDGHTASLFPDEASVENRDSLTLAIAAAPTLQREARLTVATPVLERIREAFVLVSGKSKKGPLEKVAAADGELRTTPSRLYRGAKGSVTWILDEDAAGTR
jgi:6-phosphogluconolactonase